MNMDETIELAAADARNEKQPARVYRAVLTRGAEAWQVDVPELGVTTSARSIQHAADEAAKAIILGPVEPEWGFDVDIEMAHPYVFPAGGGSVVLCDIDGTLALHSHRGPFEFDKLGTDTLNRSVAELLDLYDANQTKIILLSGRPGQYRQDTEHWLEENGIPYAELLMRPAHDNRADDLIKAELFDNHIRGRYFVTAVMDDRDRCVYLWRKLGLTCFQVADGAF